MDHWYTRDAKACHTQKTKAGAKNPERPTTIRDARNQDLVPSITSILKVLHAPWLERWKHQQIVKTCFECPAIGFEDVDTYGAHVLKKAFEENDKAMELGTMIHANIEALVKGKDAPHPEHLDYAKLALAKVNDLGLKIEESEITVVNNEHGYAGTTDLAVTRGAICGIVDFKSTKTTKDEPILPKANHATQIAAYHVGFWTNGGPIGPNSVGHNVYISTTEPGRIDVVEYGAKELVEEFEFFKNVCAIWRHRNKYDPRKR